MYKCPMCKKSFEAYEGMRMNSSLDPLCKKHQDEHDSIDWDEIAERRMDQGL